MKKRFIVLVEKSTKEQNDAFLEWIKNNRLGWWHWFQNCWLLSNTSGAFTAASVRDSAREVFDGANVFVEELAEGEGTWAGFGPSEGERSMFSWLRRSWSK